MGSEIPSRSPFPSCIEFEKVQVVEREGREGEDLPFRAERRTDRRRSASEIECELKLRAWFRRRLDVLLCGFSTSSGVYGGVHEEM
ncbi:hypothetical protein M407DRAFT_90059 [Tulasnella calospora MUT 4182]|uniref:Uncharacterized protein n=1 Tax=Tulasnella calospora MUT 4182 TaxID=1051891 RepID=A0A0C3QXG7_9AGAM|nr:hypothetical protein M407DRAFT_90059 [Tulasnella calospora MUT 4182]